jgi:hypothetical protein
LISSLNFSSIPTINQERGTSKFGILETLEAGRIGMVIGRVFKSKEKESFSKRKGGG